jgi:hypothetical protein
MPPNCRPSSPADGKQEDEHRELWQVGGEQPREEPGSSVAAGLSG